MTRFLCLIAVTLTGCGEAPNGAAPIASSVADVRESAAAAPADWKSLRVGVDYQLLDPPVPVGTDAGQVEVVEVFWYGCPHCYDLEPHLRSWLAQKPPSVKFVRVPAVWSDFVRPHARAFYAAEQLGKLEALHDAIFTEIHVNGNALNTEAGIGEFFAKFGVGENEFEAAFRAPAVEARVAHAEELMRTYHIRYVPSVVVNGKYVSNSTLTGGSERLIEVLDALVALERSGN